MNSFLKRLIKWLKTLFHKPSPLAKASPLKTLEVTSHD